jgi:DNA ligase-4
MAKLITENGGRIGDLDDPKLTHILLDKRDVSRRKELSSRTSKSVFALRLPLAQL